MIRVAACSYEGSLFGWKITPGQSDSTSLSKGSIAQKSKKMKKSEVLNETDQQAGVQLQFGLHINHGSLKAIAISKSGKLLAVAGVNERIFLFNMKENREVGEIFGHTGVITSLAFFEDSFLISGSEDSTLNVWRVHDRQLLQILGGHKEAVYSFAIHPSGKLALSVSKDFTIKLWNLVQGRCSFTRKLRTIAECVLWSPQGSYYLLSTQREVQVFDVNNNNECKSQIPMTSRINHVSFFTMKTEQSTDVEADLRIAVVCENHSLAFFNLQGVQTGSLNLASLQIGRLRSLAVCKIPAETESNASGVVITTSEGCMMILNAEVIENSSSEEAADRNEKSDKELSKDELIFGKALYAFHTLPAEPRLTAVTAWNVSEESTNTSAKEVTISSNLDTVSDHIEEQEDVEEEPQDKKAKTKESWIFCKWRITEKA